jgi:hypothetical protein
MLAGLTSLRANGAGFRSRKSMLETLVRSLHMVRLTVISALALMAFTGCTGLVDGYGGDGEASIAKKAFIDKAYPAFKTNCETCHNGSQDTATQTIGFLANGPDALLIRDTLLGYTPAVVNTDAPSSSRILTKGLHAGPALVNSDASAILEWIQAEKDALPKPGEGEPSLETEPFVPLLCSGGVPGDMTCPFNSVPLDAIGGPGSKIQFIAQALGSGLYLNNLKLIQDPTMGGYIEHPLFVATPPDTDMDGKPDGPSKPDLIDRFFNVKMNLKNDVTGDAQQIAGGTAAFVGFVASADPSVADRITIHFKGVDIYKPDMTPPGGGGGCKVPASFETNARAQLNANCGSCHRGQNTQATNSLNLTGVDQPNGATPNQACNQTLLRVNTVDLDQSSIYLTTQINGGAANHPYHFNNTPATETAFRNAVNVWINAEKTAP